MDLRFVDHSGFHRAASAMVVLGAGLSAAALPLASPLHVAPPLIGGALAVALGAGWAYGAIRKRAALAVLACLPVALASTWGALICSAILTGLAVALGGERDAEPALRSRRRVAITAVLGAGAMLLACWAGLRIHYAQETTSWAPLLRAAVSGAAVGMIGVLATLPRHVAWQLDAVLAATRQLPPSLDAEVRQLCDRSLALWTKAKPRLAEDPSSKELLRSGVIKVLEVARRTADNLEAQQGSAKELQDRIADLDGRIEAATDAETRAEYTAAREGLEDQRKYRERLRAGRERMVARLHNHVASLEKFHLAALSLDAGKKLSSDAPSVAQLAELSSEVSASGDALAELAS
jgi:hypothetical protein